MGVSGEVVTHRSFWFYRWPNPEYLLQEALKPKARNRCRDKQGLKRMLRTNFKVIIRHNRIMIMTDRNKRSKNFSMIWYLNTIKPFNFKVKNLK